MTTTDPRIIPDEELAYYRSDVGHRNSHNKDTYETDRIDTLLDHIDARAKQHEQYRKDAIAHMTEMNLRADALTEQVERWQKTSIEAHKEMDFQRSHAEEAEARADAAEQRLADLHACMGEVADCLQDGGHHFYADRIRALLTEE